MTRIDCDLQVRRTPLVGWHKRILCLLLLSLVGCKGVEVAKPQIESSFDAKTKVDPTNPRVEKLELSVSFKTKW